MKLDRETAEALNVTRTRSGRVLTGNISFDELCERYDVTGMERLFADNGCAERTRKAGLDLWYIIRFKGDARQVAEDFGEIAGVNHVEIPRRITKVGGMMQLINTSGSFVYAYQWMSSNPEVATVDPEGLVTAQKPGTTTVTALATNGQALRCAVTVNSDVGKVTLNKRDLLLRTVGSKEALTASVAVEDGVNVPITWVSSNPGVATVDASGVVTAVADGEAKITALSPDGRFDSCSVFVGLAADKYDTEEDLAEELKLPDPYVAVRMNRLS